MTKTTYERIHDYLTEDASTREIVAYWREYCLENSYFDDIIESMDEIGELYQGRSIIDMLHDIQWKDFNINHDWFIHDCWGIRSFEGGDIFNEIDVEALAEYIDEHREEFDYVSELKEIFDEDEDEDEEQGEE